MVLLRDALREGLPDKEVLDIITAPVNRKKSSHAGILYCRELTDYEGWPVRSIYKRNTLH